MSFPYPDEPSFWTDYATAVAELYAEAGKPFIGADLARYFWFTRAGHSSAGMSPEQAKVKHLKELRAELGLTPPPPSTGVGEPPKPLRALGQFFVTDDGPVTIIGCSDFALFERHVKGEDITNVLAERAGLGFNDLRVFMSYWGSLGKFDPRPHLDALTTFLPLVGSYGLRAELTVFADTPLWLPDEAAQRALLQGVFDRVVSHTDVARVEGINEYNNGDYNTTPGIYQMVAPAGVLFSLGSGKSDGGTAHPVKTYGTYHPARTNDWPRKVGHNAMEDVGSRYKIPAVSNECNRPDQAGYILSDFFDAAANAALMCAGATFHSTNGKGALPFTDKERACAVAWVAGAKAVPLMYQRGAYTAGHLSGCPIVHKDEWASRTHARIVGNKACCSVTQRKAGWKLEPLGGWGMVSQNESVIELIR